MSSSVVFQSVVSATLENMTTHTGTQSALLNPLTPIPPLISGLAFNFRETIKRAFKIYDIWLQASMYVTHFHNAVLLVWGSLRLAPIINMQYIRNYHTIPHNASHSPIVFVGTQENLATRLDGMVEWNASNVHS